MIKEGKIGVSEMISLVSIALTNKVFFSFPGRMVDYAANSAWLLTLVSCSSAIILFSFIYLLLKRFPGKNIMEIYDISLGRVIGFIFSFTFVIAVLFCSAMLIREFSDIIKSYIFNNTPLGYLSLALLLPVCISAFLGLESIARFAKLSVYFVFFGFFLLLALVSPQSNISNIFPILGNGPDIVIWQGLVHTCTYSEIFFIAVLAGSLPGIPNIKKASYITLLLSGLIVSLGHLSSVMVLTHTVAQEQMSTLYTLARQITIGAFFQRLDPLFLYVWFISTIITVSVEFYVGISAYCKTFKLQNHRPLVIPAAVIVFSVSFMPRDFTTVEAALLFIRTYGIFVVFGMPIVALIVSVFRGKKGA